jgi:CRP-like cAMP-binding protein
MMLLFADRMTEAPLSDHVVRNKFLQSLTPDEFSALRGHLKHVNLTKRLTIHDENKPIEGVYFIESGIVSRVVRTQIDGAVEVAMIGNSGFVGLGIILGTNVALHRTIVMVPGTALRIASADLLELLKRNPAIRERLLKYVHYLVSQKAQIALCNARHGIENRLARWLLMALDRIDADTVPITHDLLAMLLGVRRPGVSDALKNFQSLGIMTRGRGSLKIVDRPKLEERACACYRQIHERSFWQKVPELHPHRFHAD